MCFYFQTERAIASISKTFKTAHEKTVAKFIRQLAVRQAADVGAALTSAISSDVSRVKERMLRELNVHLLNKLATSLSESIDNTMDSESFRNVVMEASEGFVAAVDALAASVIDNTFISWSKEVSVHHEDVDDVLRHVGQARLRQLEVVRLRLKERREINPGIDSAATNDAGSALRVHICAAKVRAAEAKWEEAIAVIDRLTAQKMISPSSSSSSQTDDFGATPPLPTLKICNI